MNAAPFPRWVGFRGAHKPAQGLETRGHGTIHACWQASGWSLSPYKGLHTHGKTAHLQLGVGSQHFHMSCCFGPLAGRSLARVALCALDKGARVQPWPFSLALGSPEPVAWQGRGSSCSSAAGVFSLIYRGSVGVAGGSGPRCPYFIVFQSHHLTSIRTWGLCQ